MPAHTLSFALETMGNSTGTPESYGPRVQVVEQQIADEKIRQDEEIRMRREAMEKDRRDREERRRLEIERQAEEDRRTDAKFQKLLDDHRKSRTDEQTREDQLRAEQDKQLTRTIEEGASALDKQREYNASEMARRATDHQNAMTRAAEQAQKVENRTAERVVDLTKQKAEQEAKLHSELERYTEMKIVENKDHHARIESLTVEQSKIVEEGKQNELKHGQTLQIMKETFAFQAKEVVIAGSKDKKESHLVDAVSHVRRAGIELPNLVSGAIKVEVYIKNNMPISLKIINQCKACLARASQSLLVLKDCAIAIRNQGDSNNASTLECHNTAKIIPEIADKLASELSLFDAFLVDNLSSEQSQKALESIQTIKDLNKQLFDVINNMPVVQKTNYVQIECMKQVDTIFKARPTVTGPDVSAIQGEPSSGVVVEETE